MRPRTREARGLFEYNALMSLVKPALDPSTIPPRSASGYPEPFRSRVLPREKRALGDALGLTKIGVNLTTLMPGKESAMRHHHTREDELIYILEGEVVLITDGGEQVLRAGMAAGFRAGVADGHHLVNRSQRAALYLEIGDRSPGDVFHYPDVDLDGRDVGPQPVFRHKDGTPW
jgi:uncharacterized cupin superfamily protein